MTTLVATLQTPVGALRLHAREGALVGVYFEAHRPAPPTGVLTEVDVHAEAVLRRASAQLLEYFAGARARFELPIALAGTAFQRAVWTALVSIPSGETVSYAELARRIGCPRAVRAVGAANARNRLSIVLPCHRVIGASGALTGYAGGVERKAWLLAHEARGRHRAA